MKKVLPFVIGFLPLVVLAQIQGNNVQSVIVDVEDFITTYVIPLIIGLAVLWFIWGVFSFIRAAGDEEGRKKGRDMMIWGIVGIAVMISVWGLVNLLSNSVRLNNAPPINLPQVPQS